MVQVNDYFNGNVKSLTVNQSSGKSTVGVIKPGTYEFGTDTIEVMTVIAGTLDALVPGEANWKTYKPFDAFEVPKGVKFSVRCSEDAAYRCEFK